MKRTLIALAAAATFSANAQTANTRLGGFYVGAAMGPSFSRITHAGQVTDYINKSLKLTFFKKTFTSLNIAANLGYNHITISNWYMGLNAQVAYNTLNRKKIATQATTYLGGITDSVRTPLCVSLCARFGYALANDVTPFVQLGLGAHRIQQKFSEEITLNHPLFLRLQGHNLTKMSATQPTLIFGAGAWFPVHTRISGLVEYTGTTKGHKTKSYLLPSVQNKLSISNHAMMLGIAYHL